MTGALASASAYAQAVAGKVDLNRATLTEIEALPIPREVARDIMEYRIYRGFFDSIYELSEIDSVTPAILRTLRPLVVTMPPDRRADAQERYDASFRQVQRFLSQEGASEELADEYLDQLRDPVDVNRLNIHQLQSFQNVSPVDAVAVVRARDSAGRIDNERQLRASDGLSYWGYRNMRDYVVYEPPEKRFELHGDLQFVTFNTPYLLDEGDILREYIPSQDIEPADHDFANATAWGRLSLDGATPAVQTKVRLRGGNWKGGFLTFRDVGEDDLAETAKGFVSWQNPGGEVTEVPGVGHVLRRVDRVVAGHFRVAFGQGLVMDNTDFFLPRKTGYGWNKRPMSILGDLSRTHEFALRGVALEGHVGRFRGIGFWAQDRKDGVLNPDGTINRYIIMTPRLENADILNMGTFSDTTLLANPTRITFKNGTFGMRRDAFRETMLGGQLQARLWNGTYVGVSGYEARYDNEWDPNIETLVPSNVWDPGDQRIEDGHQDLLQARDAELFAAYDSRSLGKFRRIVGAEFQTVYENFALQGEYGKLDSNSKGGLDGLFSDAPDAYIINAYIQYSDLNLLAVWRDYDVGYDNPYARAFSQDARYEQTLLEDPFRLQNPLLSWLAESTPQMKAERGLYTSLRYRVSRNFTISGLDFDQWQRKADSQTLRRYTLRMEYAPIFPLRFRVRHRVSGRGQDVLNDVRRFSGWDTRLETRVRLSDFDELRLLYSVTNTQFVPRPRLSGRAVAEDEVRTPLGQAASPSQAVQALLTHNVNDRLMFSVSTEIYDGFLYNFEDNEFIVLDDVGIRNWFLVRTRLSDTLMMRFKLTNDRNLTRHNIDVRSFETDNGIPFDGRDTRSAQTSFRLQLDYTF